ncbi:DUF5960 family protein [Enterococcus hermanniensis]|nr:DUF5960 family protein [Enterococcus hermanniensis]
MMVNKSEVAFYYKPLLTEKLAADFMKVVDTDLPFFTIQDELLYLMNERDIPCFRIPKHKTRDGLDHVFYFDIVINETIPKLKLYKYKFQRIERRQ